jgi:sulfate adenylyltransferase subunit 2
MRRDEEMSRAKERIFSHRTSSHLWDPKNQRPEPWRVYNTRLGPDESKRVFLLSDWPELEVRTYLAREVAADHTVRTFPFYESSFF